MALGLAAANERKGSVLQWAGPGFQKATLEREQVIVRAFSEAEGCNPKGLASKTQVDALLLSGSARSTH